MTKKLGYKEAFNKSFKKSSIGQNVQWIFQKIHAQLKTLKIILLAKGKIMKKDRSIKGEE